MLEITLSSIYARLLLFILFCPWEHLKMFSKSNLSIFLLSCFLCDWEGFLSAQGCTHILLKLLSFSSGLSVHISLTCVSVTLKPDVLLWKGKLLVAQLCLTLCDLVDYSPPGSSVRGILQARILRWAAIPFSRRSSQPRDWTWVSCIAGRFSTIWATKEALCLFQ